MQSTSPEALTRLVLLLAVVGGLLGGLICFANGESLGWCLLRGAFIFVGFGIMGRWWLGALAMAWLEGRLDSHQPSSTTADVGPRRDDSHNEEKPV